MLVYKYFVLEKAKFLFFIFMRYIVFPVATSHNVKQTLWYIYITVNAVTGTSLISFPKSVFL